MKIRKGFVSNSSSSSYVVIIGEDFNPTDEEIINVIPYLNDGQTEEDYIQEIRNQIEKLKSRGWIEEHSNYSYFNTIAELCGLFTIAEMDGPPDAGIIQNIIRERLVKTKEIISKIEQRCHNED